MIKKSSGSILDYPKDENGRVSFSKIPEIMEVPNLLAIQLESYAQFLQADLEPEKRKNQGLEAVFQSVFPIESPKGKYVLEYHGYIVGESKYSEEECKERDLTYAAPLKVKLRLNAPEPGVSAVAGANSGNGQPRLCTMETEEATDSH